MDETMRIYCFRDKVINTELISYGKGGVLEDETPRGKKYKQKGGILTKVIFAVDLYFIVPNKMGWYAQMERIRDHFARELTKWNNAFEYVKEPLSDCEPSDSYYSDELVKKYGLNTKMFIFEISEMDNNVKSFRYRSV
jgi:hypothetical protein